MAILNKPLPFKWKILIPATMLLVTMTLFTGISGCTSRPQNPTMADYWNGEAEFQVYYRENVGTEGVDYHGICGISIAVVKDTWYRFNRYMVDNNTTKFGINCRKSTDKGLTWSAPVNVVEPTDDTPWSTYATDGHAIYDEKANKWRLLFQSLSGSGPWTCSYLEREGSDPMGPFTTPAGFTNPAIIPGEIWDQIGDSENDDCVKIAGGTRKIDQEGTPEIVDKVGDEYYVTFHGAVNIGTVHGFRGIAKTTDFQHYVPAAPDSIFDQYDAKGWNVKWDSKGPIGGGHATYLKEGKYWYTLIECPDKSLAGAEGQNWPFGLLRSKEVTSTAWENYPNNPMAEFQSSGYVCEWQYARLFKDDGITYVAVSKMEPAAERSFRIYKLGWKSSKAS